MRKNRRRGTRQTSSPLPNALVDYEADTIQRQRNRSALSAHLSAQLWMARSVWTQLIKTPMSSLMTSLVIAIALALPAGLFVLLRDVQSVVVNWQGSAQISVFLKKSVRDPDGRTLAQNIAALPSVDTAVYRSAGQALEEFRQLSGFGEALDVLQENPLPAVIVVKPKATTINQPALQELVNSLKSRPTVASVQLDYEWIQRLNAIIGVGKRAALVLAGLFAVAVLLIIGNTIRLTIFSRRQEIIVTKLIGATNSFIRRPFLFAGVWYGLTGAILAWVLVGLLFFLLSGPIQTLAELYNSHFHLSGLLLQDSVLVIASGVLLGLVGSWLAVTRHLQAIEST